MNIMRMRKKMMTKESTRTIYSCLGENFWTSRKCQQCQTFFTSQDYQTKNYQLIFLAVPKINQLNLEAVVQLEHKSCCLGCVNYLKDIHQMLLLTQNLRRWKKKYASKLFAPFHLEIIPEKSLLFFSKSKNSIWLKKY